MRWFLTVFSTILLTANLGLSQESNDGKDSTALKTEILDEVIVNASAIIGSKFEAMNRTGSANYISAKELQKFRYNDINRIVENTVKNHLILHLFRLNKNKMQT